MLEVKTPSEIRAYKSKLFAGLSVRQVISIAAACTVGVPLGVFGSEYISRDVLMWVVIVVIAPIIAWGFLTFNDMKFEDYVRAMWEFHHQPKIRVYEDTHCNLFMELRGEILEEEIIGQRIESGEYIEKDGD